MKDKDWLEKIKIAYMAYPYPTIDIESFISWLYKQYGIVEHVKWDKCNIEQTINNIMLSEKDR